MNTKIAAAAVVALGIAAAAWLHRGTTPVAEVARSLGLPTGNATPDTATTLKAAGVHKCVGAGGTSYLDVPCPRGTREVAAHGGTLSVTSFPKPTPAPSAIASAVFGGPVVRPLDPEERDRLRDKAIEDAANRR